MSQQQMQTLWEMQSRQAELRRHVVQLTTQISGAERERNMLDVTVREMDAMPDDTKVYMAIGKMFALTPKPDLRSDLVANRDESQGRDAGRKALREQFVAKLKESDLRLDELTKQIEASRAAGAS